MDDMVIIVAIAIPWMRFVLEWIQKTLRETRAEGIVNAKWKMVGLAAAGAVLVSLVTAWTMWGDIYSDKVIDANDAKCLSECVMAAVLSWLGSHVFHKASKPLEAFRTTDRPW